MGGGRRSPTKRPRGGAARGKDAIHVSHHQNSGRLASRAKKKRKRKGLQPRRARRQVHTEADSLERAKRKHTSEHSTKDTRSGRRWRH